MSAIWKSIHPDVLAWWADVEKREKKFTRLVRRVQRETGRKVIERTGFGDRSVIGLSSHSYNEEPPLGWKLGWGKRGHGFFEPRAKGRTAEEKAAVTEANELMKKLRDADPYPRKEANERFGVPKFIFTGLQSVSPGFECIDGALWVVFGDHDYEIPKKSQDEEGKPMMADYFSPVKRSEYYAVREAAGIEEN